MVEYFLVEAVAEQLRHILLLHPFEGRFDLLSKGVAFSFSAHALLVFFNVELGPVFLRLLSHRERAAVLLSDMLNEGSSIPNKRTLDCIYDGAGFALKAIAPLD